MMPRRLLALASLLPLGCCAGALHAAPQEPAAPAPERVAEPETIVVPQGTSLALVLQSGISTRTAKPGQAIYLETLFPVVIGDRVVIPAGSFVRGELVQAKRAGRVKGRAEVRARLDRLILPNGYSVRFDAHPTDASTGGNETVHDEGKIKGDTARLRDVAIVLVGGAVGAYGGTVGAIMNRDGGLIPIGTAGGTAAGLLVVLLTRGPDLELPRGSTFEVALQRPLELDAARANFADAGRASALPAPADRRPKPARPRLPLLWP